MPALGREQMVVRKRAVNDDRWIALVVTDGSGVFTTSYNERFANARLIAAAPELLEACKLVLNAGDKSQLADAIHYVRAATLKAEGTPSDPEGTKSSTATGVSLPKASENKEEED
jgi:hypothetical protein